MAGQKWQPDAPVADEVSVSTELASRLGFTALVALLERLTPEAEPVGTTALPSLEAVRFRHDPDLAFSSSDVRSLKATEASGRKRFEVTSTFLGLTGSASPLPTYLTEEVALEDEGALRREFLDLFHHRLLSLLYRSLRRMSLWGEQTRALDDVWSRRLLALSGIDAYDAAPEGPLTVAELLSLTPLLAAGNRSGPALERALQHVLGPALPGVTFQVEPFAASWAPLDPSSRWRLGRAQTSLGADAILGDRCFERDSTFGLRVGPLTQDDHRRLMPGGDLRSRLEAVVDLFNRDGLSCRLILDLAAAEVPRMRLSAQAPQRLGRGMCLGAPRSARSVVTDLQKPSVSMGVNDAR